MAASSSSSVEVPPATPSVVLERVKTLRTSIPQPGGAVDRLTWPTPATLIPNPCLDEEPDATAYAAGAADGNLVLYFWCALICEMD